MNIMNKNCGNIEEGLYIIDPYLANFPKDNKSFPQVMVQSYFNITKRKGFNLWGKNYWKASSSDKYSIEYFTGFIKADGTIVLVEDDPHPEEGSSGYFELVPCGKDTFHIYYYGLQKGITFRSIIRKFERNK